MLGADARLLTENEEIKSFNLFARITAKETLTGETDTAADSELKYLQVIRDVQDNESGLFDRIKRLPHKCRTARRFPDHTKALLTYFRLGKLDKVYLSTTENPSTQELDFLQAVKILESEDTEKIPVGKEFFALAEKNRAALERGLQADHETVYAAASNRDAATRLMRRLHVFKQHDFQDFTDAEEKLWQTCLQALKDGAVAKKTVVRMTKDLAHVGTARGTLEVIKKNFSLDDFASAEESQVPEPQARPREVILSEYFI
jgi:hypothetical protein